MDEHQAGARVGAAFERSLKNTRQNTDTPLPQAVDAAAARLQLLAERMAPVVRDLPDGIEIFDTGFLPGPPPRYWVDMISFVEMAIDSQTYRFLQDSRQGRTVITENANVDAIADAVTAYMAQRLLDRERQLAELQTRQSFGVPAASPYSSPYAGVAAPQAPSAGGQWPPFPQAAPAPALTGMQPPAPQQWGQAHQAQAWAHQAQSWAPPPFSPPPAPQQTAPFGLSRMFGKGFEGAATPSGVAPVTHQAAPQPVPLAGISYRMAGLLFLVGIAIGAIGIIAFALSAGR